MIINVSTTERGLLNNILTPEYLEFESHISDFDGKCLIRSRNNRIENAMNRFIPEVKIVPLVDSRGIFSSTQKQSHNES